MKAEGGRLKQTEMTRTKRRGWQAGLLAVGLVLLLAGPGRAAGDTQWLDKAVFEAMFTEIIVAASPLAPADLLIDNLAAQPAGLEVPAGEVGYQVLNRTPVERTGRKALTLAILVDGRECGRVRVQGQVRQLGEVIYTTRALKRDTVLGPDDLRLVRQDVTMLGANPVIDPGLAIGKRLNTALAAGAILYSGLLTAPTLVDRGNLVTIRVRSRNLLATAPGEARNAGAAGDLIRVKNLASRKEIFARVVDSDIVEAVIQ